MKKHLNKKTLLLSLLSMITLGVFIILAISSDSEIESLFNISVEKKYSITYYGFYCQEIESHPNQKIKIERVGYVDYMGRWRGEIEVTCRNYTTNKIIYTEKIRYEKGIRQGMSTREYTDGSTEEEHYVNGRDIGNLFEGLKNMRIKNTKTSAYHILRNYYPWFLATMDAADFDSIYVEAYTDTLLTVLNSYEFDVADFDDYYEEATDEISETPYDSIITFNTSLSNALGLQEMKNNEFRLAVIDYHRKEGSTIYGILETDYPNYILMLNEAGVNNPEFEVFCNDLEDSLALFEPLNMEDPSSVDSLDARLFIALLSYLETEKSSANRIIQNVKRAAKLPDFQYINHIRKKLLNTISNSILLKSTSSEVSEMVLGSMLLQFYQGDLIKRSVKESYLTSKGVYYPPLAATVFSSYNSASSVTVKGIVIEDGGAEVTERGIAWATYYNPVTGDNVLTSGSGTGQFTITVDGLTEGTTYYARSFATNSAGTAYGNCISFVAAQPSEIIESEMVNYDFTVFPNPASTSVTFSFQLESSENVLLTITDMKGQQVLFKNLGCSPQGRNQVQLDLSGLKDGMYICLLTNGTTKATHNLIITH